jgi:hypothetical protein
MANLELDQMERSIAMLRRVIRKSDQQLPAWVQSKITRAADFVDTAAEYLSSDEGLDEGIVSRLIDKMKGRTDTGERTGSGGKIYVTRNPNKSTVKYPEKPKPVQVNKSSIDHDDPWLKSSSGAEKKAHYRQLRGESKSFSEFMKEASFEIGAGHKSAQKQAKIGNLADKTDNPNERDVANKMRKGPEWKKPKL